MDAFHIRDPSGCGPTAFPLSERDEQTRGTVADVCAVFEREGVTVSYADGGSTGVHESHRVPVARRDLIGRPSSRAERAKAA